MILAGHNLTIKYEALEFDLDAGATAADLVRMEMSYRPQSGANELRAYFSVSGQNRFLEVFFPHVDIFRVIDDMHLPLGEHGFETVGHIPNHFAYKIKGSPFWAAQREVFEISLPGSTHYRFATGGNCLDVITRDEPCFCWVNYDDA
ncbi:hypothetical protein IFT66_16845 [Rhizobium sp. CFBP 13726]|uniref:hypothetical protein n=1 Tax=Rhizobium sp. CFBP 13726 TaxID=2775296 RepID=UPI00177AB748|nr:hypothetical protein [Rhizobium sp. CFBP 13726]MBD8652755.1 hypothetical protein [Rhizobium sp. CFBP 13726]